MATKPLYSKAISNGAETWNKLSYASGTVLTIVDAAAAQYEVAAFADHHPGEVIAEDVIVFQRSLAILTVDHDTTLPAIVDAVAAQYEVAAFVDLYPGAAIAMVREPQ